MMARTRVKAREGAAAFTLLESLVMLVVLAVFTLLVLGVTKPMWMEKVTAKKKPAVPTVPVGR